MTSNQAVQRLRFGVIGCADIAWRRTLPAMADNPAIETVAIASRDKRRATEFTDRFGGTPLGDYAAVVESEDVDAVYIPLPLMMHAEWVERCLDAGKHVLVEKPMTDSYKESSRLVELARSRGLVLMENYMFLHHSQHAAVRKMLDDGVIGELRGFRGEFTIPPKPPGDIRYQLDVGGGPFLDFGGYPVRAALHVLGKKLQVVGAVFRRDAELDVVMSGSVLLATEQGVPVQLTFGMEHSYQNAYSLTGSTGRLMVDWAFTPPHTHRPVVRIERQDHREELVLDADHQFANVIDRFVATLRTGEDLRQEHEGTLEQAALMEQIELAAVNIPI
ncbi:Gfo/Idh/MocA family oxidoreductase [Actinocrispum sp. NPDC049592]|uniref:Gfo/Idh/MocA family protein n=1 Tax=Actinocrispum sp. NPDC049592 TaxID=3154835 RepID=UPI003431EA09